MAVFLYCVCHVVIVVVDSMDEQNPIFKSVTLATPYVFVYMLRGKAI